MVSSSDVFRNSTLLEILEDLSVRFIINLPNEELGSVERVYFQIEEAQWYFEDFVRKHNPYLPTLGLRQFAARIFQHCPILQKWGAKHEEAFAEFMAYKTKVPVRGAVMLNETLDKCVLVKGYKSNSLSFPRGKINKEERDEDCAVREVLEETGYDLSGMVTSGDYIEITMREQNVKLYVVPGVPEDTDFCPRTRNEIAAIEWHSLADLPTFRKKKNGTAAPGSSKFYMVTPFVTQLRKWIASRGANWLRERQRPVMIDEFTEAEMPEGDETYDEATDVPQSPRYDEMVDYQPDYQPQQESVESQSQALRSLLGLGGNQPDARRDNTVAHETYEARHYEQHISTESANGEYTSSNRRVESNSLLEMLQGGGHGGEGLEYSAGPIQQKQAAPDRSYYLSNAPDNRPSSLNPVSQPPMAFGAHNGAENNTAYLPSRAVQDHSPAISSAFPQIRPSPLLSEHSATLLRTLKSGMPVANSGKPTLLSQQFPVLNNRATPEHGEPQLSQNAGEPTQAKSLLSILRSGMVGTASVPQHPQQSPSQITPPMPVSQLAESPSSNKGSSGPMSAYFPQLSGLQNNTVDGNQKASLLATLRSRETARRLSTNRANSPLSSGSTYPPISSTLGGSPVNRVSPLLSNFDRRQSVRTDQAQSLLSKFRSSAPSDSDGKRSVFSSPEGEAATLAPGHRYTASQSTNAQATVPHVPAPPPPVPQASAPTPTDQGFLFNYLEMVGREAG